MKIEDKEVLGTMKIADAKIRTANQKDVSGILELLTECPGVEVRSWENHSFFEKRILNHPKFCLVAECGGEIIGCLFAGDDGFRLYLHHLAVAEMFRNHGIGKALLVKMRNVLDKYVSPPSHRGRPRRIMGTISNRNPRIRNICTKLGFEVPDELVVQMDI